jgi:hypothetical protein
VRIASDIRQQRAADRLQEELRALRLKYGVVSP